MGRDDFVIMKFGFRVVHPKTIFLKVVLYNNGIKLRAISKNLSS